MSAGFARRQALGLMASTSLLAAVPAAAAKKRGPLYKDAGAPVDLRVSDLLSRMTLEEKVGQLTLLTSDWESTGPTMRDSYQEDIRAGKVGNIFNAYTAGYTRDLQKLAVENGVFSGTEALNALVYGAPSFVPDKAHGLPSISPLPSG